MLKGSTSYVSFIFYRPKILGSALYRVSSKVAYSLQLRKMETNVRLLSHIRCHLKALKKSILTGIRALAFGGKM